MNHQKFFIGILLFTHTLFGYTCPSKPFQHPENFQRPHKYGQGWSFDLGGQYTWMGLSTPPTYSGNTGGVVGKLSYQRTNEFFGQIRTIYNIGPLKTSFSDSTFSEWYSEFVGGYCFYLSKNWSLTPYLGLGLDYLWEKHPAYRSVTSVQFQYNSYYALGGFDTHYTGLDWMVGIQIECLPIFDQYTKIDSLPGAAWQATSRAGAAVRLPIAYRYARDFWLEMTPYYRYFPIGGTARGILLQEKNLTQVGLFVTFRFFL